MNRFFFQMILGVLLTFLLNDGSAQADWPQWRGPHFTGVSTATGLPTTWSETDNIVWKTPLPSWSGGTPIIWGDRVFVTSPSASDGTHGAQANRPAVGRELLLLCLDKNDGSILWERVLGTGNETIGKQNDSSPSPLTDGEHVWVMTGAGVLAGFTMTGTPLWRRNLQEDYGAFGMQFGYGSSPLLYGGKLFVQVLHGYRTDDPSWLAAIDPLTGDTLWRVERPTDAVLESPDAYTTPIPVTHEGRTVIVVAGGDYVTGHDPDTGEEVWRAAGLNPGNSDRYRMIASPVSCGGLIYAIARQDPLLAIRPGGEGDVTESHLAWTWSERHGSDVPTPVCDGAHLYMAGDRGMIMCLDRETGDVVWGPERTARGVVSASPLLADGKIYITNEEAVTTVVKAGPEFELLATNTLDEAYTLASIAVSEDRLFLRTATHLYCIGKGAE